MADLSAAEKARVLELARKTSKYKKAAGLMWLYDPVNDRLLPAVCDEQGYIKIDPTELDERYVKKSGDTMEGDLNAHSINPVLNITYVLGTSAKRWQKAYISQLYLGTLIEFGSNASIKTPENVARYIALRSYDGAAYQTAITLIGGYADFNRAGDITGLATKTLTFPIGIFTGGLTTHRAAAANTAFAVRLAADAVSRLYVQADGKMWWGDGTNAVDVNLYRSAADILKTDDVFQCAILESTGKVEAGGSVRAATGFYDNGVAGVDGTFKDFDEKVVTVSGGIITNLDT